MINLDHGSETPLYLQIYEQCKTLIIAGRYPANSKLPSVRFLAEDLMVSKNTVDSAYSLLSQEGYVSSLVGSGFIVQQVEPSGGFAHESFNKPSAAFVQQLQANGIWTSNDKSDADARADKTANIEFDFTYGNLEAQPTMYQAWQKLTTEVLAYQNSGKASMYPDRMGLKPLREQIAQQLHLHSGVNCHPAQVIIQAGTQSSLYNLLNLFNPAQDKVAFEEPGYDGVRHVFENAKFELFPIPVWRGNEVFLQELQQSQARLAYVTPSNQFPTGMVMDYLTRKELLNWAATKDVYILEDDYCREFRYSLHPLPSLQSLDRSERVVYMGTFSKALTPALRISYLVLPPELLLEWNRVFDGHYSQVPWLSQAVLWQFMEQGHWEKHLRKVQALNKRKHGLLIEALDKYLGDKVNILESGSGLHLLVGVDDGRGQQELIAAAAASGVKVYDTNRYWLNKAHALPGFVLVGFSAIAEAKIAPGIKRLAEAWF